MLGDLPMPYNFLAHMSQEWLDQSVNSKLHYLFIIIYLFIFLASFFHEWFSNYFRAILKCTSTIPFFVLCDVIMKCWK